MAFKVAGNLITFFVGYFYYVTIVVRDVGLEFKGKHHVVLLFF